MSKNKLNSEEQAFRNKINEAHFSYDESAWQGVKGQLKGSATPATYSPLLKAAAGLLVITSLVFVLQNQYNSSNEMDNNEVTTEVKTESKQKAEEITPSIPVEKEKNQKQAVTTIQKSEESQQVEKSTNKTHVAKNSTKKVATTAKKEDQNKANAIEPTKENTTIASKSNEELTADIQLIGNTCLHQKVTLKALINDNPNAFHYQWKVNKQLQNNSQNELEITLDKAERYSIELTISNQEGEKIAYSQKNFDVVKAYDLDFTYEDQTGLFDDYTAVFDVNPKLNNLSWKVDGNTVEMNENKAINFGKEGIFDVELSHVNESGCVSSIQKPVLISSDFKPLINAFTPNGDDINDFFMPEGFSNFKGEFKLSIYSLDGVKVFESNSPNESWNGKLNNKGRMMPDGNYIWKIEVREGNQQRFFTDKVKLLNIK